MLECIESSLLQLWLDSIAEFASHTSSPPRENGLNQNPLSCAVGASRGYKNVRLGLLIAWKPNWKPLQTVSQSVSWAATDYSSLFDHVISTSWFKALDLSSKQEGDLGHFMKHCTELGKNKEGHHWTLTVSQIENVSIPLYPLPPSAKERKTPIL